MREEKEDMELPNHAKQILLQLNQQRAKGFLCDVIIVVENALFRAHKNILAASSIYFKSLMLHDNLINLDTEMVNPSVFRQILDFIYTGKLLSSDQTSDQNFTALLTAASYLQLHDLAALCRKKLKRTGCPLLAKPSTPSGGRPLRAQRPSSSTPLILGRALGRKESQGKKEKRGEPDDKLSDEDRGDSGGVGGQELGLDLSKKSPLVGIAMDEVSPNGSSTLLESPPLSSSTVNSASFEEPQQGGDSEPMEVGGSAGQGEPQSVSGGCKSSRQISRKKEWPRKDGEGEVEAGVDPERPVLTNGLGRGVKRQSARKQCSSQGSDRSFVCKEEEEEDEEEEGLENGREHSDDSGQSEAEGGRKQGPRGAQCQSGTNYVFRQEGFEPALGDNLYVCIPCGKGFPSSEQLNAHVETHTEEELYIREEDLYAKEATEAEDLSSQAAAPPAPAFAVGSEPRPFKCTVCARSYKDPATLRQHEKSHWLTRPFPCNICGKMFTQRGTMTRHMRSHLGLKPFACEECGMRFTRQYRLTEHMRVHSGEKPYECQLCGGKFTQQRNLISHLRMHSSPS